MSATFHAKNGHNQGFKWLTFESFRGLRPMDPTHIKLRADALAVSLRAHWVGKNLFLGPPAKPPVAPQNFYSRTAPDEPSE